jgi:hypothetical protein
VYEPHFQNLDFGSECLQKFLRATTAQIVWLGGEVTFVEVGQEVNRGEGICIIQWFHYFQMAGACGFSI